MDQNNIAKNKLDEFIGTLASLGLYQIQQEKKKPQIFTINGARVNIRSRARSKQTNGSIVFWYSAAFNVLEEVDWVIYLTTRPEYFFMFPSSFLLEYKDRMYPDASKANVGIFDIDWEYEEIKLRGGPIKISDYYHNLLHEEDFPRF